MIQDFREDLKEMCGMISGNLPFAFLRFADGEVAVMKGDAIIGIDNWTTPDYVTKLGKRLLNAISNKDERVYFGISCKCCDLESKRYLLKLIKNKPQNVTFSNLFVNNNHVDFIKFISELKKPCYLIANECANLDNFPLKVLDFVPIPNECVNYYEENEDVINTMLKEKFSNIKDSLFLISAGPISEAIIDYLWTINPNNQYVDVGSSIAEFIHDHPIRCFKQESSPYYNKTCKF